MPSVLLNSKIIPVNVNEMFVRDNGKITILTSAMQIYSTFRNTMDDSNLKNVLEDIVNNSSNPSLTDKFELPAKTIAIINQIGYIYLSDVAAVFAKAIKLNPNKLGLFYHKDCNRWYVGTDKHNQYNETEANYEKVINHISVCLSTT